MTKQPISSIISDVDEHSSLNGQSSNRLSRSSTRKQATSTETQTFLYHLSRHSTVYLLMLTLLVISVSVIAVERIYRRQMLKKTVKQQAKAEEGEDLRDSMERHKVLEQPQAVTVKGDSSQKYEKQELKNFSPEKKQELIDKMGQKVDLEKRKRQQTDAAVSKTPDTGLTTKIERKKELRPIAGITPTQRQQAKRWLGMRSQNISDTSKLKEQEIAYYEKRYNISGYQQLPFCIVVPSYNNVKNDYHFKNMRSILMQEYSNFHIVFIDDASSDGTGTQIEQMLSEQTRVPSDRYKVIRNSEQRRAMPNLRMAAKEYCKPTDIFLIVDGDDELIGSQVLKLYSALFQKEKAWFVYSNFLTVRYSAGYSRPFPLSTKEKNSYRSYPFVTSHLRAFYTQLFLNIKQQDLQDENGQYLKAANDVAICIPILQMSHTKVMYVPELTYYYNSNTGQNNHKLRLKEQKGNLKMIKRKPKYEPLQTLFPQEARLLSQSSQNKGGLE